jgi:hypothetical protein
MPKKSSKEKVDILKPSKATLPTRFHLRTLHKHAYLIRNWIGEENGRPDRAFNTAVYYVANYHYWLFCGVRALSTARVRTEIATAIKFVPYDVPGDNRAAGDALAGTTKHPGLGLKIQMKSGKRCVLVSQENYDICVTHLQKILGLNEGHENDHTILF